MRTFRRRRRLPDESLRCFGCLLELAIAALRLAVPIAAMSPRQRAPRYARNRRVHRQRGNSDLPVLQVRVRASGTSVPLEVLCAGYELTKWRGRDLVRDTFDNHLLSFALNYSEYRAVSGETAMKSLRDAAISVYTTDKYGLRGEFGEMLLHGALVDFYGADPVVSKIYYEDSANDVVKGFDSVHIVPLDDGTLQLWLGEAKFYNNLQGAVSAVLKDVSAHLDADFLRKEFMFIGRKVDDSWPHADSFKALVAPARSLDEIASSIVMPVFLTYDSEAVAAHDVVSATYIDDLTAETTAALSSFENRLSKPLEVQIRLILVPLKSKRKLVKMMHKKLRKLQEI